MEMMITTDELKRLLPGDAPVPLKCQQCHEIFYSPKYRVLTALKGNGRARLDCCSTQCSHQLLKKASRVNCLHCGKSFEKLASEIKKSPKHFCSRSCAAYHNNRYKTKGLRRSHAETFLTQLIQTDFPHLTIENNARQFLSSGAEIDILIRACKIAIEVNGLTHYSPIYGDEKLQRIQQMDVLKETELRALGFTLITIDISHLKRQPKTELFITGVYRNRIQPLIQSM